MHISQAYRKHIAAVEAHEAAAQAHRVAARLLAAGSLIAAIDRTRAADHLSIKASEVSAMADFCLSSDVNGNVHTISSQPSH